MCGPLQGATCSTAAALARCKPDPKAISTLSRRSHKTKTEVLAAARHIDLKHFHRQSPDWPRRSNASPRALTTREAGPGSASPAPLTRPIPGPVPVGTAGQANAEAKGQTGDNSGGNGGDESGRG